MPYVTALKVVNMLAKRHKRPYKCRMKTVNRSIIDKWIKKNGPDGIAKLANKSLVPSNTIAKVRVGKVPKSELIRDALARALDVLESDLFPTVGAAEKKSA